MHAGFNPSKAPIQELASLNVSDVNVIQAEILPPENPAAPAETPAAPASEPKWGDSIIPSMEEMKREQLAIREELDQVFQSFKDFGSTHCREVGQRRTDFTDLFLKLKALVERV